MSNRRHESLSNRLREIFKDDEELRYVASLPEVEREKLLFERQQLVEEQLEKSKLVEKVRALEQESVSPLKSTNEITKEEVIYPERSLVDSLTLSRKSICSSIFRAEFGRISKGCYVRLSLDPKTYRLCEIARLIDCEPYQLDGTLVNKKAVLRQGKSEREFKFDVISNQSCSDEELAYFFELEPLSRARLKTMMNKAKECSQFLNHPMSEEEINQMLLEKRNIRLVRPQVPRAKAERTLPPSVQQPNFLKLQPTSLDPSDPFSRKKTSKGEDSKSSSSKESSFRFFSSDPACLYDVYGSIDLDESLLDRLIKQ
jgi:hypothetical protein